MPNSKVTTAFVIVFLLAPRAGFAYPLQGVGSASCAEFAKLYQGDPNNVELTFFSWAQGFMSGLNLVAKGMEKQTRDLGEKADRTRALRAYCADNPLKSYMDGVIELYGKLPFSPPQSN